MLQILTENKIWACYRRRAILLDHAHAVLIDCSCSNEIASCVIDQIAIRILSFHRMGPIHPILFQSYLVERMVDGFALKVVGTGSSMQVPSVPTTTSITTVPCPESSSQEKHLHNARQRRPADTAVAKISFHPQKPKCKTSKQSFYSSNAKLTQIKVPTRYRCQKKRTSIIASLGKPIFVHFQIRTCPKLSQKLWCLLRNNAFTIESPDCCICSQNHRKFFKL